MNTFLNVRGAKLFGLILVVAFVFSFGLVAVSKTNAEGEDINITTSDTSVSTDSVFNPEEVLSETTSEETTLVVEESVSVVEETVDEEVTVVEEVQTEAVEESTYAPEISSDKDDYHPGETVSIFGKLFQGLTNFVVSIFGSDDNDENYVESSNTVTSDENGSFTTSFNLDNLYRPFYEMTASDLSGNVLASGWFRDSAVGTYDQCSNDLGIGYGAPDAGCRWINGNINGQNSTYAEGDSTVQRLWLRGYAPGEVHTITFQYGTTKGGKHAYDFLTNWDHSEGWISEADLCQTITNCVGTLPKVQASIPPDSNAQNFDNLARNLEVRGASSASIISGPSVVSGTYGADSETQITVQFTVDGADSAGDMCSTSGPAVSCDVAIFFGAHIAKTSDWVNIGGQTGATTIPGSPYHVSLSAEDGASIGNRDNQMQASAIPATITIIKKTVGDNGTFNFTTTGGNGLASNFSITTNSNTGISSSYLITKKGTYTVTEGTLGANWNLTSISCDDPTTNSTVNVGTKTASINLADGESVVCTFTNTKVIPQNVISGVKFNDINGNGTKDGSDVGLAGWTITLNPGGLTTITGANGIYSFANLADGTYNLCETSQATWTQTYPNPGTFSCGNGTKGHSITVSGGGTTSNVDFGNYQPGHIIVDKVTNPSGDSQSFNFTTNAGSNFSLTDTAVAHDSGAIVAGTYSVSEGAVTGWDQTSATCSDGSLVSAIAVSAGETVTCTFTNTKRGHLIVQKTTLPAGDLSQFSISNFSLGSGIVFGGANGTVTDATDKDYEVTPGTFSVEETVPAGWTKTGDTCQNVSVAAGETKYCLITNTKDATLTLVKTVTNDNGGGATAGQWTLTGTGPTNISGATASGAVTNAVVIPGVYTLGENSGPVGYTAGTYSCVKNGGGAVVSNSISLVAGDDATCTITNDDIAPKLKLVKTVQNNYGGTATTEDFQGSVSGVDWLVAQEVDWGTFVEFDAGTYTAGETSLPGYSAGSWGGDCATDGSVTLLVGDVKTCTITNSDIPAKLTIVKIADPKDCQNFAFAMTGQAGFSLDDDAGVQDCVDTNQAQSQAFINLNAGNYTVTETQPNQYWKLDGVSCVVTGTQTSFPSTSVSGGVTVNLPLAGDVTCTFKNLKTSPTRTQGFWQTHTAYTTTVFNSFAGTFKVGSGLINGSQDPIDTINKMFGGFYSNISKKTVGGNRTALEKARMQLAQQLIAAKLNCKAFGCAVNVQTMITNADIAYAGTNVSAILASAGQMDAYNNSGDTIIIGSAGKATPKTSQGLASMAFWDTP